MEFTKGIIGGTKTTTLTPRDNGTFLEITWDVKFKGMAGFMSGKLNRDFQDNTEQAILAIKQEAEAVHHNHHLRWKQEPLGRQVRL